MPKMINRLLRKFKFKEQMWHDNKGYGVVRCAIFLNY